MNDKPFTKPFLPLFCLLFCLAACTDGAEPLSRSKKAASGTYFDYQVWGEEGQEEVTIRLQYRLGGEEGDAVATPGAGSVLLDGEPLAMDSTKFTGPYYEISKPVQEFRGKHTISYVDSKRREHREVFSFEPFTLAKELPENLRMKPFRIQLQGFPAAATPIRLVMIDTSMESADVNEELMIEGGVVEITQEYLENLTKGPVTLEIYREEERPITTESNNSGKFAMHYGLRRQFVFIK